MKLFLWKPSSVSELAPGNEFRFEQDLITGSELSMSSFFLERLAFLDRICDPGGIDDLPSGWVLEIPTWKADWFVFSVTGVKLALKPCVTDLLCPGLPA
jgi:hypothetical protein